MFQFMKILAKSVLLSNPIRSISSNAKRVRYNRMKRDYYVWIDLEMTGLNEQIHKIVEIACIVTDAELNTLHDGIHLIVHQPKEVFDNSEEWPKAHHAKSGLMEESLNSNISVEKADELVAEYVKNLTQYEQHNGKYYLAGNTVYMDKRFLEKYMVNVDKILHYRLIDVSTIKTLCSHWYPEVFNDVVNKKYQHRALSDVLESIHELKVYRENFFKSK